MSDPSPQDEPATNQPPTLPSETIELEIAAVEASLPLTAPASEDPAACRTEQEDTGEPQ